MYVHVCTVHVAYVASEKLCRNICTLCTSTHINLKYEFIFVMYMYLFIQMHTNL